jgi:hydrogenase maturation factor
MCLGSIALLAAVWDEDGVRLGRLDDGCVVPLAYVPDARPGAYVLLHLGIPVEILSADAAQEALNLRMEGTS